MNVVPVELLGAQRAVAVAAADIRIVQELPFDRPKELQAARSHLLSGLGESLYDYSDRERISQRRNVYVAREGKRVITLCYRWPNDSGSLQIAYDSAVDYP